jgi:hypothetical protein
MAGRSAWTTRRLASCCCTTCGTRAVSTWPRRTRATTTTRSWSSPVGRALRGQSQHPRLAPAVPSTSRLRAAPAPGSGDLWMMEGRGTYDGANPLQFVWIVEFRGDKVQDQRVRADGRPTAVRPTGQPHVAYARRPRGETAKSTTAPSPYSRRTGRHDEGDARRSRADHSPGRALVRRRRRPTETARRRHLPNLNICRGEPMRRRSRRRCYAAKRTLRRLHHRPRSEANPTAIPSLQRRQQSSMAGVLPRSDSYPSDQPVACFGGRRSASGLKQAVIPGGEEGKQHQVRRGSIPGTGRVAHGNRRRAERTQGCT